MIKPSAYWWKKMPFARLLPALVTGILLQYEFHFPLPYLILVSATSFMALIFYFFLPVSFRYRFGFISGTIIFLLVATAGALVTWRNDVNNQPGNIIHQYKTGQQVLVILQEPLVEKANSYKALARVVSTGDSLWKPVNGKIIVYFKKDSPDKKLGYGTVLAFHKTLQPIRSAGNPGAFDYRRYCLFQGITHQVFLQPKEFQIAKQREINWFRFFIFDCRHWVVKTIKNYIPGEKEQGLAQALLIGYKDDLDKDLVQSYSNTGVVHVIAISGLHLGLIYSILMMLTKPIRKWKLARLLLIVVCLWTFSIIAGAQPSVLRSALMFSCIALSQVISRKGSVYNTLCLSAFILLCYQPYWLWDAGFQLSYAAVFSIILFYRQVYGWFFIPNKLVDLVWQLNAVTISAQLLTLPVSIYHFHQFPLLFLFTNFIAVPLSSLILIGEIILCAVVFFPTLAFFLGKILHWLIYVMNSFIERFDLLSFAVWKDLFINDLQAILLTVSLLLFSSWLVNRNKTLLLVTLASVLVFLAIRDHSFSTASSQKKLVVYNIPGNSAIEIINGRKSRMQLSEAITMNGFLWNFHLQPSKTGNRIIETNLARLPNSFQVQNQKIILIDTTVKFRNLDNKIRVDLVIISKNPKLYMKDLLGTFEIGQLVLDSSVPSYKSRLWKKDCDSLGILCHEVRENGAFVMPF